MHLKMPICPDCGYENLPNALICAKCYALLVESFPKDTTTFVRTPVSLTKANTGKLSTARLAPPNAISLYVGGNPTPLILYFDDEIILGRYSQQDTDAPRVDLSAYGAYQLGVSRLHASLSRKENEVWLTDLDSANGTLLNGQWLTPHTPVPIKSGDRFFLSQLQIEIYLAD